MKRELFKRISIPIVLFLIIFGFFISDVIKADAQIQSNRQGSSSISGFNNRPDLDFTGKSFKGGIIPVDGHVNKTLTANDVGSTLINNYNQTVASTQTLPACSTSISYSFVAIVETQVAQDWKFLRNGTDTLCLDGVCSKTYFLMNNQPVGSMISCISSTAVKRWNCRTILGTATTD